MALAFNLPQFSCENPKKTKKKQTLGSKYEKALMILTEPQQNLIPAALGQNWGLNKRIGEKKPLGDCNTSPFKVLPIPLFSKPRCELTDDKIPFQDRLENSKHHFF